MVTWPMTSRDPSVKVVTPKYLRLYISITMQDKPTVITDHLYETINASLTATWPTMSRDPKHKIVKLGLLLETNKNVN